MTLKIMIICLYLFENGKVTLDIDQKDYKPNVKYDVICTDPLDICIERGKIKFVGE